MRIGLLIDTLAMGGAEQVAVICAGELAQRGHAVTVMAYHPVNDFVERLNGGGVETVLLSGAKSSRLAQLRRIFRQRRFDVVHAFKAPAVIWGICAAAGLKQPRWFGGHHALTSESRAVRWLCRLLKPRIHGWIVPSQAAAEVARRDFRSSGASVHVVPNPVRAEMFHRCHDSLTAKQALGLSPGAPVVTMVANLHPWKNHDLFLRVAQRVCAKNPEAVFLAVGRDTQQGAVQTRCAAMGLGGRVRFLGQRADVMAVLEATDVAVITSFKESFCLALAEAGAMGVPSVATDNGGASEVIVPGKTGFIVPLHQIDEFAGRIESLLEDKSLCQRMGLAAHEWTSRQFSVEAVVDRLEHLYTRIVLSGDDIII